MARTVFIAILLVSGLSSCFSRQGEITLVSESEPLTIKVDPGTAVIDWIWFQGPLRNRNPNSPEPPPLENPKGVIVWQISPRVDSRSDKFSSPDKYPVITYGQLPEGWQQLEPETGAPAPLLDGFVYTVNVVTFRSPRPAGLCVYVNKGRLEPYVEKGNPSCEPKEGWW